MIYFDNSATSFYKPKEVKIAVLNALNNCTANAGRSSHYPAQLVGEKVFNTREKLKNFFHAPDFSVIFTKNCSEALNLAIRGILKPGDHVIATCYEHNSVLRVLNELKNQGVEITILDCDLADFSKLFESKIRPNTKLVITTAISNVTGEVVDYFEVGKICKNNSILYLVDGAQACGHIDIDLTNGNVSLFAFSGHKGLLSITGVGGLLVKNSVSLTPILYGGTGTESENLDQPTDLPEGFEVGTLPTIPIISLEAGIDFLSKNFLKIQKIEENLTKYLQKSLKNLKFLKIYSKDSSKNVFSFNLGDLDSSQVANELNERFSICVRSGLHCAPLIHKKLGTTYQGAVRVSIDFNNTKEEIDRLVLALKTIYSFLT